MESWTIKKVEHRRIDAFELWCWRRLLRVPWTAKRSIQFILKEISPEYSLERLMLKLKLQYFGTWCEELTHWKRPWCRERLRAGRGDDRGWNGWMASPTQWTWVWVRPGSWWGTGRPGILLSMGSQRVRHNWATELNWTGGLARCKIHRKKEQKFNWQKQRKKKWREEKSKGKKERREVSLAGGEWVWRTWLRPRGRPWLSLSRSHATASWKVEGPTSWSTGLWWQPRAPQQRVTGQGCGSWKGTTQL